MATPDPKGLLGAGADVQLLQVLDRNAQGVKRLEVRDDRKACLEGINHFAMSCLTAFRKPAAPSRSWRVSTSAFTTRPGTSNSSTEQCGPFVGARPPPKWKLRHGNSSTAGTPPGTLTEFMLGPGRELRILDVNEAGTMTPVFSKSPRHPLVRFPDVDIHGLPFSDASFDLVVHSETLEDVTQPVHALSAGGSCARAGLRLYHPDVSWPTYVLSRRDAA
jgi:hypothetical protein